MFIELKMERILSVKLFLGSSPITISSAYFFVHNRSEVVLFFQRCQSFAFDGMHRQYFERWGEMRSHWAIFRLEEDFVFILNFIVATHELQTTFKIFYVNVIVVCIAPMIVGYFQNGFYF